MKDIRYMIMCLVAAAGAALAAAQDQTAPPTAEARSAALQELRAKQNALDKLFKPCPVCKGKGKVSDVVCSECGGERRVFTGQLDADFQTHIDNYVAFCELLEKHAAILEADPAVRDRFYSYRSLYLGAIRARMGKRQLQDRAISAQGHAEYRPSKEKVPPYTRLACDLLVASPNKARGHGLAFDGVVTRLYSRVGVAGGDPAGIDRRRSPILLRARAARRELGGEEQGAGGRQDRGRHRATKSVRRRGSARGGPTLLRHGVIAGGIGRTAPMFKLAGGICAPRVPAEGGSFLPRPVRAYYGHPGAVELFLRGEMR